MKTIRAMTQNGDFVRVKIPDELYNETTHGHREVGTGVYRLGVYFGRKWAVVVDYSTWVNNNGECEGNIYWARRIGIDDVPELHRTDWTNK